MEKIKSFVTYPVTLSFVHSASLAICGEDITMVDILLIFKRRSEITWVGKVFVGLFSMHALYIWMALFWTGALGFVVAANLCPLEPNFRRLMGLWSYLEAQKSYNFFFLCKKERKWSLNSQLPSSVFFLHFSLRTLCVAFFFPSSQA
ncbi:hypothetical protein RIF29_41811 [Crotalaria pallida]|uniref:Uncharacterized protein n=1 Tax=Crotalaria pallida TaxID=3830 RepID=A0AAN9E662_CROPI